VLIVTALVGAGSPDQRKPTGMSEMLAMTSASRLVDRWR
jgi:hypothetical protein